MGNGLRWTEEQLAAAVKAGRKGNVGPRTHAERKADLPPPKYRNRKVENEHGKFDSQKEAARYAELVLLERAGAIAKLRRQVPYALVVNGVHVCDYIADAVYCEGARVVCEDTKSDATRGNRAYRIKVKLMLACHGIEIKEA